MNEQDKKRAREILKRNGYSDKEIAKILREDKEADNKDNERT